MNNYKLCSGQFCLIKKNKKKENKENKNML